MSKSIEVARALLDIKAVGIQPHNPIRFKSGLLSPVYVDNRRFPYHPAEWKIVIIGFQELIKQNNLTFDVIAGIETAGIPHSAALSFAMGEPSVFVRKKAKDHGTKKVVEGGDVKGKRVLLIEDHVTTGGSSLTGVEGLRAEGATVNDCLAITSYEFDEADKQFSEAGVNLHTLTTFSVILEEALSRKMLTQQEVEVVQAWFANPHDWEKKYAQ